MREVKPQVLAELLGMVKARQRKLELGISGYAEAMRCGDQEETARALAATVHQSRLWFGAAEDLARTIGAAGRTDPGLESGDDESDQDEDR